ncbi:MAG: hypothetical protein ABIR79_19885 [Candidatus Binatia bacterium]
MALARRGQMIASRGTDVWPDGARTARFGFIHALYQSTLYQQLAPARRSELHRRMGERLERGYASAVETVAPELAQHFTVAGDVVRARIHLRRAADRALQRHAYPEAIGHLERALAALAPAALGVSATALPARSRRSLARSRRKSPKASTPSIGSSFRRSSGRSSRNL